MANESPYAFSYLPVFDRRESPLISRRIVSHASLRMLNFLASVMREFLYEEIDRKNRIFGRKTDILRKCVARCAILLNIYGKKDCFDVSSYNWAHKHHFIVRKTKKTYLSDCENSHEKQQTGIFCELKLVFICQCQGKFIQRKVSVH